MLEILQYVTSGFWVFVGCLIFTISIVTFIGWSLNAVLIGIRALFPFHNPCPVCGYSPSAYQHLHAGTHTDPVLAIACR